MVANTDHLQAVNTYRACFVDLSSERDDWDEEDAGGIPAVPIGVPEDAAEQLEDVERMQSLEEMEEHRWMHVCMKK